jgi:hypothetical protein
MDFTQLLTEAQRRLAAESLMQSGPKMTPDQLAEWGQPTYQPGNPQMDQVRQMATDQAADPMRAIREKYGPGKQYEPPMAHAPNQTPESLPQMTGPNVRPGGNSFEQRAAQGVVDGYSVAGHMSGIPAASASLMAAALDPTAARMGNAALDTAMSVPGMAAIGKAAGPAADMARALVDYAPKSTGGKVLMGGTVAGGATVAGAAEAGGDGYSPDLAKTRLDEIAARQSAINADKAANVANKKMSRAGTEKLNSELQAEADRLSGEADKLRSKGMQFAARKAEADKQNDTPFAERNPWVSAAGAFGPGLVAAGRYSASINRGVKDVRALQAEIASGKLSPSQIAEKRALMAEIGVPTPGFAGFVEQAGEGIKSAAPAVAATSFAKVGEDTYDAQMMPDGKAKDAAKGRYAVTDKAGNWDFSGVQKNIGDYVRRGLTSASMSAAAPLVSRSLSKMERGAMAPQNADAITKGASEQQALAKALDEIDLTALTAKNASKAATDAEMTKHGAKMAEGMEGRVRNKALVQAEEQLGSGDELRSIIEKAMAETKAGFAERASAAEGRAMVTGQKTEQVRRSLAENSASAAENSASAAEVARRSQAQTGVSDRTGAQTNPAQPQSGQLQPGASGRDPSLNSAGDLTNVSQGAGGGQGGNSLEELLKAGWGGTVKHEHGVSPDLKSLVELLKNGNPPAHLPAVVPPSTPLVPVTPPAARTVAGPAKGRVSKTQYETEVSGDKGTASIADAARDVYRGRIKEDLLPQKGRGHLTEKGFADETLAKMHERTGVPSMDIKSLGPTQLNKKRTDTEVAIKALADKEGLSIKAAADKYFDVLEPIKGKDGTRRLLPALSALIAAGWGGHQARQSDVDLLAEALRGY